MKKNYKGILLLATVMALSGCSNNVEKNMTPEMFTPIPSVIPSARPGAEESNKKEPVSVPIGEEIRITLNEDGSLSVSGKGRTWAFNSAEAAEMNMRNCLEEEGFEEYADEILSAKDIFVEEGITELGEYSFSIYPQAEYVELSSSVEEIAPFAFCSLGSSAEGITVWNGLDVSKCSTESLQGANGIVTAEDGTVTDVYDIVDQIRYEGAEEKLLYEIPVGQTMYRLYDNGVLEVKGFGTESGTGDFLNESALIKHFMIALDVSTIKDVEQQWFSLVEHVLIRDNVKHIGDYALARMKNVKTVTISGTPESFGKHSFSRLGFVTGKEVSWNGFNCLETEYKENTFSFASALPEGAVEGINYVPESPKDKEQEVAE